RKDLVRNRSKLLRGVLLRPGRVRQHEDDASREDRLQLETLPDFSVAPCPSCQHPITIAEFDVDRGEIFVCPACGIELELLGFDPLRLARAEPADDDT